MRFIPLTKGKSAIVDDQDFDWLNQWKWTYLGGKNNYAYRKDYSSGAKTILMHRLIINAPRGLDVDHKNRNGLDNRRSNLRAVDRTQNNFNSGLHKNNKSGVKGVIWFKPASLWRAYIGGGKNRIELGYFKTKEKAIAARIEAESRIIECT